MCYLPLHSQQTMVLQEEEKYNRYSHPNRWKQEADSHHCCCCWVTSVMSDSVRPHPWDPPGKNTGVGCPFLLQCIKVKSESEVAQSCLTLHDPMDCSLPGSSTMGFSRQEDWSGVPLPSPIAINGPHQFRTPTTYKIDLGTCGCFLDQAQSSSLAMTLLGSCLSSLGSWFYPPSPFLFCNKWPLLAAERLSQSASFMGTKASFHSGLSLFS